MPLKCGYIGEETKRLVYNVLGFIGGVGDVEVVAGDLRLVYIAKSKK